MSGIDEVSRRKGQVYLTVVYDLGRRVLLSVGDDRTAEAVKPGLHPGTGAAAVPDAVGWCAWTCGRRTQNWLWHRPPNAQILFDRFHIAKHLNEAVDAIGRIGSKWLVETFLRRQLGLKAHTVTKVEENGEFMVVHIERLGPCLLRCGVCRQRVSEGPSVRKWLAAMLVPTAQNVSDRLE